MKLQELKRIIVAQSEEIKQKLEKEKIIKREVDFKEFRKYLSHPNILAILGIRRCGKSVLSWQILKKENLFPYINFDDERLAEFDTHDFDKLLQSFYELYGEFEYVVFDGIQNVAGFEFFLNRMRRTKKVIITGSNSRMLAGELSTRLTGRYIDFTLFPFSFREFLKFNNFTFQKEDFYSTKKIGLLKRMLEEYLKTGGLPEGYLFGREILVRIYQDILDKDILRRYKVKKKATFKQFCKYLISNTASEFSLNRLKNVFGVKDIHTLRNWLTFLEEAYLIIVLERFSFKLKEQMIAPKKVYCMDSGLINVIGFSFSEGIGKMIENVVAIELLRRKSYWKGNSEIYYWKDYRHNEVDFVVKEGNKIKQLIQVSYDIQNFNTKEREIKNLIKASKELKCDDLLVINWDYEGIETLKEKEIKFMPLWKWLLQ
ncbi:MAG: hypothetical protein DRI36_00865 [Caldiserica bacterium]|nr:MAG: hypothetical protein DRI36_00865 [Caldisericota bacterium]